MNDLFHNFTSASEPKTLRPHQVRAIDQIRRSLAQGNRRVVCQMPTGAGKTLTAAKIIEGALAKRNRVIFTAPAVSLIDQTVTAFENEGIGDIGVMQANHPRTDRLARVQIASVQTLARREIPEAAMVIVDECHISAKVIDGLLAERPDLFAIGMSATPWRAGMGRVWQDLVIPVTIGDLIRDGYLSEFRAFAPSIPDLTGVKVVRGEYVETQLAAVMGEAKLMGSVVEEWLAKGEDRPTLAFGVNRAHAATMTAAFIRAGVAAEYVDGECDSVEREGVNRRFRSGETRVICSVRTMTTGVDLPVSCIIDAAPTKSEMLHIQKLGRGLRVNPGTEDLLILDHAGNCLRLGLPTDIHHARLDATKPGGKSERKPAAEKLPQPCSQCGALHTGMDCPACGHQRKPGGPKVAAGDLAEVTGRVRRATNEDKQRFYSMALSLADMRGKPHKFAAGLFMGKFGSWPKGLHEGRTNPDTAFLNYERSRRIAYAKRLEKERAA